jgi:two-component system, OmpR family, phosphate regulon sensor histidine kinase PhoR
MLAMSRVWKLYMLYTIVLVITMTFGGLFVSAQLKKKLNQHLQKDMLTMAKIVAKTMPDTENQASLDAFCRDYKETLGNIRITIIRPDGKVLGESDRDSLQVQSHLERPEVIEALQHQLGTAVRYSETLHVDMLYLAIFDTEKNRIVRVSAPVDKLKAIENNVLGLLALSLYLVPILVMGVTFFFARVIAARNSPRRE